VTEADVRAVFNEGLTPQAQRLGIYPYQRETKVQFQDRVRRSALFERMPNG